MRMTSLAVGFLLARAYFLHQKNLDVMMGMGVEVQGRGFSFLLFMDPRCLFRFCQHDCGACSGRAGREGPGKCFRLYTESTFEGLPESTVPEMRRADVSSLVLQLKALGVHNLLAFPLPDPPPKYAPSTETLERP